MYKNIVVYIILFKLSLLASSAGDIHENQKKMLEKIMPEKDVTEIKISHEKIFSWKQLDGKDDQLMGYLDSEIVASAHKLNEKSKLYKFIHIYINNKSIGTILVSIKNNRYKHTLNFENINDYKITVEFEVDEQTSFVRIENANGDLVRLIKISAKTNLIQVGPRHKDLPW